jgi:hypothetical protein
VTIEFRYATFGEYHRISKFLDEHWAKDHVYVRMPRLFEWTFDRNGLWDQEGYSFALAEDKGEIVGILGGIPFVFNCLGWASRAIWLANYMVRPDYRRGPTAMRLLSMFRRSPYDAVVAFGVASTAVSFYRLLRWQVLEDIPRHFAILPDTGARTVNLLHLAHPDWEVERAEALARFFRLVDFPKTSVQGAKTLPLSWNDYDWLQIASRTVGAARDLAYLTWRYLEHPCFAYRFIAVPEGNRTGLAVWRLETIHCATPHGREEVDRIGRLVEFLPVSRHNAKDLLSLFWHELYEANAFGADYYGYHGESGAWLREFGFQSIESYPDGHAIPSRFQPLESKGGRILSAVFVQDKVPTCSVDPHCVWYWTKSDADQDRPN